MKPIDIEKYFYRLPRNRIAEFPLKARDESKLLVAHRKTGSMTHHLFKEIPGLLPENSFLVLNSTKVIPARFLMQKETGGIAELLLIEPVKPSQDPQITLLAKRNCVWDCLVGGSNINNNNILSGK